MADSRIAPWKKRAKYRNVKTVVDGITFDSKREAAHYGALKALEAAGEISCLRLQVPFVLADAVVLDGRKRPARKYVADFVYRRKDGSLAVVDVKGMKTDVYTLKRHLMASIYGIEVQEI